MSDTVKFFLEENKLPKFWYNINADLPSPPPPPLHPGTKQPAGPDDFAPLFPMGLIMQEVSTERNRNSRTCKRNIQTVEPFSIKLSDTLHSNNLFSRRK